MKIFEVSNVASALPQVVDYLIRHGRKEQSRNGSVLVSPTPVMTIYDQPDERVLFSPIRDANPFFHLMEAMWMLHGDNDAKFLNYYVKDFGDRYGEDGILHGAYGYRWRTSFGFDQIQNIIQKFRNDHYDRQCVLQMWDCTNTMQFLSGFVGNDDLKGIWKDRPCHTQAYFRINDGKLDMTTTARSHDAYWGATGANAVHFGFLQEYIAAMVGVPIGKFYQFSHNYHMYEDVLNRLREKVKEAGYFGLNIEPDAITDNRYFKDRDLKPSQFVTNPSTFDEELKELMIVIRLLQEDKIVEMKGPLNNTFLWNTVYIAAVAHKLFKDKKYDEALKTCKYIQASDWFLACYQWLERRIKT